MEPCEHRLNAVLAQCVALKPTCVVFKPCNDNVMHCNQIYFFMKEAAEQQVLNQKLFGSIGAHCMGRTPRKLRVIL